MTNKEIISAFIEKVERRAEQYMLKTGKLEGMHYRAMKDLAEEMGIDIKPVPPGILT